MAQRAPLSLDSVSTPPPAGPPPQENGRFPGLLFEVAPAAQDTGQRDEDRSFAADLNLGQIVAAIAGDREERDLITTVLYGRLRDSGAVRYRQEIFQDLYYQLGGWLAEDGPPHQGGCQSSIQWPIAASAPHCAMITY